MKLGFDAKRIFHNSTGLGNYGRDLISILSSRYSEVDFKLYNPKARKIDRLELVSNITEVLPNRAIWKKASSFWRQGPIVKQLVNDNVDIYHGLTGELPRGLKKRNIKSVVTIHDLIFVRYPNLYSVFDRKIHFKKHLFAAQTADKIIAISEQTKKDIIKYLNVSADKVEVIYQSCHAVFKKNTSKEALSGVIEKFNLPDNFVLNVSTIEKRKNTISLVKAIKDLDTKLVIVGKKGDAFQEISAYIQNNNITHKVIFLEGVSLEELAAIYKLANLFVLPSIFEGFGIPIIEAMYSKTPVITTFNGVFPEVGGPSSIYIDPFDISQIKNAIQDLLSDQEKSNLISEKSYEYVQKFSDDNIAKSYMKVYEDLLF